MPEVVMYTTASCPYCIRARNLLDKKGVTYTDIRVDAQPETRSKMEHLSGGATSVPQIFIDDFHVGGYDDMAEMDMEGDLNARLGLA